MGLDTGFNGTDIHGAVTHEPEPPFLSVIAVEDGGKIIGYDEYCDLLGDLDHVASELACGFIFVEGDMLWFLPDFDLNCARLGSSLREALLWDVDGERCSDGKWRLPKQTRANMEQQLVVLREVGQLIEHALANDLGEEKLCPIPNPD